MTRDDLDALKVALAWVAVFLLGWIMGWLCHSVAYPFGEEVSPGAIYSRVVR